jgi:hypothetical protein
LLDRRQQVEIETNDMASASLTQARIDALKPQPRPYKVADGGGLHLLVQPNGSKLWRLAYRFGFAS